MSKKKKELQKGPPTLLNRKARHNYTILDTFVAGVVLSGPEVKSLRAGKATITESYIRIIGDEVWLMGMHILPYENAGYSRTDPTQPRKLLLHRREINRMMGRVQEKGQTLVPLKLFWSGRGLVKLEMALAEGKNKADKRETLKRKQQNREMQRALRDSFK